MTLTQLELPLDAPDTTRARRAHNRGPFYPIDPLLPLIDALGEDEFASRVGLHRTAVNRRRHSRRALDTFEADKWAIAAGRMPWELWDSYLDDEIAELTEAAS